MKINLNLTYLVLVLFLLSSKATYPRPKITYFAKLTCHSSCGNCSYYTTEQKDDPCLRTFYYTASDGKHYPMKCETHTLEGFANPQQVNLAKSASCLFENNNLIIACDELVTGRFRAYSKADTNISVIAYYCPIPVLWQNNGWSYKFIYNENSNQLQIKVFPLVYTNDSLFISNQNENGGYNANLSISDLENQLSLLYKKSLGIEVEKHYFSIDEIKVQIFPNPVFRSTSNEINTQLTLPNSSKGFEHTIKLFDINGKLIYKEDLYNLENKIQIKGFETGVYFIEIYDSLGVIIKKDKLIIQ
ncbi:MAG: T9SS type A sorting domain-containing protein [Bacteroidetes bacterium]|nr:T9SS type A sorting domain-containing protein [Bacteroidota bacterium]